MFLIIIISCLLQVCSQSAPVLVELLIMLHATSRMPMTGTWHPMSSWKAWRRKASVFLELVTGGHQFWTTNFLNMWCILSLCKDSFVYCYVCGNVEFLISFLHYSVCCLIDDTCACYVSLLCLSFGICFCLNTIWAVVLFFNEQDQEPGQPGQEGGAFAEVCTHTIPCSQIHGICCDSGNIYSDQSQQPGLECRWLYWVPLPGPAFKLFNVHTARDRRNYWNWLPERPFCPCKEHWIDWVCVFI